MMSRLLVPKICDFGISRIMSSSSSSFSGNSNLRGTLPWMAVELLCIHNPQRHSMMSDVWAFGMTIYVRDYTLNTVTHSFLIRSPLFPLKELLTRNAPYSHLLRDPVIIQAISAGCVPTVSQEEMNTWPMCYYKLWQLCQACWKISPIQRPTMKNVSKYIHLLNTSKREVDILSCILNSSSLICCKPCL